MASTYLPLSPENREAISLGLPCLSYPLQFLANIAGIIYFALTRSWIALGMVGTFAFLMLLAVVAGIIFSIISLTTLDI